MSKFIKLTKKITFSLSLITFLFGCATSPKVQVVKAGDETLTKQELLAEIEKLNTADQEINSKKGVTGTNVAAALFFWPGLVYTHLDASEANRLVDQRRNHLTNLYNKKVAQEGNNSNKRRS